MGRRPPAVRDRCGRGRAGLEIGHKHSTNTLKTRKPEVLSTGDAKNPIYSKEVSHQPVSSRDLYVDNIVNIIPIRRHPLLVKSSVTGNTSMVEWEKNLLDSYKVLNEYEKELETICIAFEKKKVNLSQPRAFFLSAQIEFVKV